MLLHAFDSEHDSIVTQQYTNRAKIFFSVYQAVVTLLDFNCKEQKVNKVYKLLASFT